MFCEHHLAHIASSYEVSGFSEAVGIVVDGIGETAVTTLWRIQNHQYEKILQIDYPNSLGYFYAIATKFLGFEPWGGEGKTMALAAYGKKNKEIADRLKSAFTLNGAFYDVSHFMHNHNAGFLMMNEDELIDMKNVCINTISYYLSQLIHGSMYLCPALLCSNGEFNYYGSGGCRIGNGSNNERPVEHIMSVMKSFGASIEVNPVGVHGTCNIDNSREPVEINISNYSTAPGFLSGALVGGATKTAIIMSLSREKVIIKDPYLKTDVLDMIAFIQLLGKKVVVNQNELIISGEIHKNCKQAYRVIQA